MRTGTGRLRLVVAPSPSWPLSPYPQQRARPVVSRTQVWPALVRSWATPVSAVVPVTFRTGRG